MEEEEEEQEEKQTFRKPRKIRNQKKTKTKSRKIDENGARTDAPKPSKNDTSVVVAFLYLPRVFDW